MKTKSVFCLSAALWLSACVTSPQQQTAQLAQAGEWQQIGYQDGVKGQESRSMSQLTQLGTVNFSQYEQGYQAGIEAYCNPDLAYQIGLSGQDYLGVCNGLPEGKKFRLQWQRGWNDYNH